MGRWRDTMGSQSLAPNPALGRPTPRGNGVWSRCTPKDKWKAGEMGIRGAEGLHVYGHGDRTDGGSEWKSKRPRVLWSAVQKAG